MTWLTEVQMDFETLVVKRCRNGALYIDHVVVGNPVQLLGADAGFDMLVEHFQHLSGQPAGYPHFLDFFRSLDGYLHGLSR